MRIGLWDDIDLGWYFDDFIGFDSSHRMGIQYNGTTDDGGSGGHPINSYGTDIPMVGMTIIEMPGDTGAYYAPAGSFIFFNNDASVIGNPSNDTQYNYYLHARTLAGTSFFDGFSGYPQCQNHDSIRYYCYAGDLADTTQCTECALHNLPGDRRFIITTNDLSLPAGASSHLLVALVATNPDTNNACGGGATFDSIRTVADTAWADYHNPPLLSVANQVSPSASITIYPNPAHDILYVEKPGKNAGEEYITVYNSIGQTVNVPIDKGIAKDLIDISVLPPGLYHIVYDKGILQKTASFIKE